MVGENETIGDLLVPVSSALQLRDRLPARLETLLLPGASHAITADADREALGDATVRFLARHADEAVVNGRCTDTRGLLTSTR